MNIAQDQAVGNSFCNTRPRELIRRFNEDEAVWRCFERRRARRRLFGPRIPFSETVLDRLDWMNAESECRDVRCVGERMS